MDLAIPLLVGVCVYFAVSEYFLTEYKKTIASYGSLKPCKAPVWVRICRPIGSMLPPVIQRLGESKKGVLLQESGKSWKPVDVLGLQTILGVVALFVSHFLDTFPIPLVILGWMAPIMWLKGERNRYHTRIQQELPTLLDILVVAAEAGLSLGNCLQSVVEQAAPGPATRELGRLLAELKVGKTSKEALTDLSNRVNQQDLRTFARTMIQAQTLGTSSGRILRILAAQIRFKRAQRAEAAALKAPVKMVFPLVFFFFPALLIVFLGPFFLRGGIF